MVFKMKSQSTSNQPTNHVKILQWYIYETFEDIKGVIRTCKSKNRQYNVQKKNDKQWSTKHYSEY